jgi:outer membrane protein, adhesin transport system
VNNLLRIGIFTGLLAVFQVNLYATSLHEVMEQTILTNPGILEQYNNKILREYEVELSRGGFYPKLDFDASGGIKREEDDYDNGTDIDRNYKSVTGAFTLKQLLYDGSMTRSDVERLESRVESAFFQLYNLAEETAILSIKAYTDVLLYQKYVEFAETNLKSHEKMYDQIEMRSMLGADDQSSLSQMKGRLQLALSNVEAETNNLQDRWTEYRKVVGSLPKDALENVTFDIVLPETYAETLDYALANHPALASSKADVVHAKLQKEWAKAFYYPRVELQLRAGMEKKFDYSDNTSDVTSNDQSAILGLNWNLYNGGSDKSKVKQFQYDIQTKDEHLELQRRRVEEDVAFAWNTYKSSEKRLDYLAKYVKATQETGDAYLQQFQIGERTLLDLLNTENEIFEAQKEFLSVKYQNILAKYRVLASMGTLLEKTKIHLVTDEYYQSRDLTNETVNDLEEKNQQHNQRELEKRNSPDKYTDMRFFKMNNNLRTVNDGRRESK